MLEPSRKVAKSKKILDYLKNTEGYTYGYSEEEIKALEEYKPEYDQLTSYGAFLGADEFEEYAISLFVLPDGDGYKYVMYVGFENGLGTCQYASCDVYYSELEVLERLRGFERSYSRWH